VTAPDPTVEQIANSDELDAEAQSLSRHLDNVRAINLHAATQSKDAVLDMLRPHGSQAQPKVRLQKTIQREIRTSEVFVGLPKVFTVLFGRAGTDDFAANRNVLDCKV